MQFEHRDDRCIIIRVCMGEKSTEFEGKIRNDFSIKISHLDSFIVSLVFCVVSRSI